MTTGLLRRATLWRNGLPVFPSTTVRDAVFAAPQQGDACYVDDGTSAEGLFVYSGTAWRPGAWNSPWGVLGFAQPTAVGQTGITTITDLTGLTVTFTRVVGRQYKTTFMVTIQQATSPGILNIYLTDGSNTQLSAPGGSFVAGAFGTIPGLFVSSGAAGSVIHKLRGSTNAGTLTISQSGIAPNTIVVEDIGASGAPT